MSTLTEVMVIDECQMKHATSSQPLAKAGLVDSKINYWPMNSSSELFFSKFNNPEDMRYWYWYGKVEGSLKADVSPNDNLWIDATDYEQFGLYMWLSGPDMGPWWHYDQDHNFYVQVTGTKRFVLIPPWESEKMHPYPQIHPRNHKAQVDFDRPNFEKTPLYSSIKEAYIAELSPGQVLYIPPYWWHHVRSHTRSVSLASWSQSGVYRKMRYGLYKRNFVVDTLKNDSPAQMAAFKYMIEGIAQKLMGEGHNFFQRLVRSRWDPIRAELVKNGWKPGHKVNGDGNQDSNVSKFKDPNSICYLSDYTEDSFGENLEEDINAAVEAFQNCQTKVGDNLAGIGVERKDMKAISQLEFADFIEYLVNDLFGPNDVLNILENCLEG